ncbi:MAG TPA: ParB/RepB/Spo0J family partition protein [Saprospiraceae bacterium]|nr:ParB/RepB/Spo0J family partition protein [Saprospiraceae bacterium]
MAKKVKKELGKGIRALLADDKVSTARSTKKTSTPSTDVQEILLSEIEANPYQPRKDFIAEDLEELVQSIKTYGIIQPITLRRLAPNKYQIISGERRYRASKIVGLTKIPAYLRTADDQLMLEMALVENIQRADLNALEVAITYQRLIDECGLTHESLAERVGKKRSSVTNYLRLQKLPPEIKQGLKDRKISMGHARELLGIDDVAVRISVYKEILEKDLSVRATEQLIKLFKNPVVKNAKPAPQSLALEYKKVQEELEHKLETKVNLKVDNKGKGAISIPFSNTKDLNRILDILDL